MGKIGILTYHTGYNYGASLQAFALQSTIQKLGFDNEIINFETEKFKSSREMFAHHPRRVKEFIKIITRIPYYSSLIKRQEMFDDFTENCLKKSKLFRKEHQVIENAENYDCIVCGSDQIWNLSQTDPYAANLIYYLNFPKKQKRVSYAASFGRWVKSAPYYEDVFLPWLKQFDYVSVREVSGVEYVRSLGLPCELTLDPTVLLDKEDYEVICRERIIDKPYVLLFSWNCSADVIQAAKDVAYSLNLPLYNIVPPPRALGSGIKRKLDVGPREFLSMIKYADFIVTNSFHGTVFSMTFEKNFASIFSEKPDTRMESLLTQLGLSDHLIKLANLDIKKLFATDYSLIKKKKQILRKKSIDFLQVALKVN